MAIVAMIVNDKDIGASWHNVETAQTDFKGNVTVLIKSYTGSPAFLREKQMKEQGIEKDLYINMRSYVIKTDVFTLENIENKLLELDDFKDSRGNKGKRYFINSEGKAEQVM